MWSGDDGLRLECLLRRADGGLLDLEYPFSIQQREYLDAARPVPLTTHPSARPRLSARCRRGSRRAQERTLLARLEAARQVRVTCLGQARRRVRLVRESKAFRHARTLPHDDPARKALFREARAQRGFSDYALHAYAQQFGHSWLGEHLDSLVIQTLASRAYRAANRLLLGKARRVRFKGRHQLDTVEGKTKASGIRWRGNPSRMDGARAAGALDPKGPGAGARAGLPGEVRAAGPAQARARATLLCAAGVRVFFPSRSSDASWAAGSSGSTSGPVRLRGR